MAEDESTSRVFAPVGTVLLLAVLLAVFFVERRLAPAEAAAGDFSPATLAGFGAIVPMYIDAGQWWRFFTGPLLHQSVATITSNGVVLAFSAFVERRMGWRWYLLTFAVGASMGAAATYLRLPPTVVATGASGGIQALFAAGLMQSFFAPDRVRKLLAVLCFLVLALGLLGGGDGSFFVDRVAHISGMIAGCAMGLLSVAHWNAETAMPTQATAVLIALCAYGAMTATSGAIDALDAVRVAPASQLAQAKAPSFPPIASPPIQPPLPITPAPGGTPPPAETRTPSFQPIAPVPTSPARPTATLVPEAPRTSIPVALRLLPDEGGERVYSVQVRYGSRVVDSVLGTEDAATQILPGRLPATEFTLTSTTHAMTYGFGGSYASQLVHGEVGIGAVVRPADVGLVGRAGCAATVPKCAIVDEPVQTANFGYDTYPALLGIAPTRDRAHPSVPVQLGFRRYLLVAPRGDGNGRVEPGQLVFNPTDDETRGFVPLTMDPTPKVPGAVHGCMRNLTNAITFCGAILFDTDFSGIEVYQQKDLPARRNWSTGDKVKLMFTDPANTKELAGVDFMIGVATVPVVRFGKPGLYSDPVIRIGQVPYLGLEVLTDLVSGQVAVAARKTQDADAVGRVP